MYIKHAILFTKKNRFSIFHHDTNIDQTFTLVRLNVFKDKASLE